MTVALDGAFAGAVDGPRDGADDVEVEGAAARGCAPAAVIQTVDESANVAI